MTSTATTYLPTEVVSPQTFCHFNSTVSALNTDIQGAFSAAGTVVVQADTVGGQTSNALIIVNDNIVFTVPPGSWVGYNRGRWSQFTNAQMNGDTSSVFTQYFSS